jgi:hypothetical protein
MLTMFLGIICNSYNEYMWKDDVKKWEHQFVNSPLLEIPMKSVVDLPNVLDAADAIKVTTSALSRMNDVMEPSPVRFVLIGPGHTEFLFSAIEHLLKQWEREPNKKSLRFVVSGDPRQLYFEFCKKLCLQGTCHSIQFYNTMDYHPFGFYKNE